MKKIFYIGYIFLLLLSFQLCRSALACSGKCVSGGCPSGYAPDVMTQDCPGGQTCCKASAGTSTDPNSPNVSVGSQCKNYGGSCQIARCDSSQFIGTIDCPNASPYCCGSAPNSASTAQQQMFGGGLTGTTATGGGGNQSAGFGNPIGPSSIEEVLGSIMSYLRGIAGTIAVIFIIIGGVMYMLSGGSKEMTERAKKTLIFAIVGLAIVLAAPLFYQEIKAVLSGSSPGSALQQLLLNILKLLLSIVGFLAIISMVIGAIWMFTAVGDEDRYELGKKTATYSILGLAIALGALVIANQVTSLIGG